MGFDAYPMHELAAHPDAAQLFGLVDAGRCFETAGYLPTPRSRKNERLRLTLPELAPVADRLAKLADPVNHPVWTSLETRTEAAYVRQALAGDWPAIPDPAPGELALVRRPNLDVYAGLPGLTGPYIRVYIRIYGGTDVTA